MPDTDLSNVRVIAEDIGTGAPAGDLVSGGDLLALGLQSGGGGYIEHGYEVTYDPSTTQIDVTGGLLFALYSGGVAVEDSQTGDYTVSLNTPITFPVYSTGATGLSVDAGAVNEVWVSVDRTGGDSAFVRYGSTETAPPAPALKIAEVDTSTGEVTPFNADPSETFEEASVTSPPSAAEDVVRKADLDAHSGDTSNPHAVGLEQARQQDNSFEGAVTFPKSAINVGSGQFALVNWAMVLGSHDQTTRGDTGASHALEKTAGGTLSINPQGDFFGGVNVGSELSELGSRVLTEDDTDRFESAQNNTDISFADGDYTISWGETAFVDASTAAGTITLPPPADGPQCTVKKVDESANKPILATPGTQTIDGETNYPIVKPYDALTITDDGTNYYLV